MRNPLIVRCLLLVLLSLGMTACISVNLGGDPPPPTVFALQAPDAQMKARPTQTRGSAVVVVSKPEVPPALATDRIALRFEQDRRIDYYADAKWSGKLDDLVQEVLIDRAQQRLPMTVVGKPGLASGDYRLAVKVTSLEPVYKTVADAPPRLDVEMTVTVIDLPEERVRTQFAVRKSARASENRLTPITAELGKLLQSAIDEALARAAPQFAAA
jgi:ABC-type uncharacterized transport system auxiliary subunit